MKRMLCHGALCTQNLEIPFVKLEIFFEILTYIFSITKSVSF